MGLGWLVGLVGWVIKGMTIFYRIFIGILRKASRLVVVSFNDFLFSPPTFNGENDCQFEFDDTIFFKWVGEKTTN